ncbi:MAG: diguanylate cyclase [Proteobacteria bacterium]|nr:diguanylate cyclase [Pseudomonadota bacterium]
MNHTPAGYSNRPASRRLHRRLASGVESSCVHRADQPSMAPIVIGSLPQSVVREAGMYELLAAEMRIAELEKALAEASAVACIDPLTGALNRRGFDQACRRELARARRSGTCLALAHIDLDDFKRLNDTLGHQAGDQVLVRLVELLHRSMRPSDVLCRFGGEEFVLMLSVNAIEEAAGAVARFLREFSAQRISGADWAMSFSAGVTLLRLDESLEQTIERADAATYAAKRAGKNRVVSC